MVYRPGRCRPAASPPRATARADPCSTSAACVLAILRVARSLRRVAVARSSRRASIEAPLAPVRERRLRACTFRQ
eukprot:2449686-Prymnesium_polylepis.1